MPKRSARRGIGAALAAAIDWSQAHADLEKAVEGMPRDLCGRRPDPLAHSAWEILEHLRIAQHDILDFCRNAKYKERKWPDDYWPATPAPPDPAAWDASVARFRRERNAMKRLATEAELLAKIPHGTGQTYLREVLLVLDHNAYHVAELIAVRRLLGAWPS